MQNFIFRGFTIYCQGLLLDEFHGRKTNTSGQPSFISWVPPEEDDEEAEVDLSSNVSPFPSAEDREEKSEDDGQSRGGPVSTLLGEREREHQRLQNIRARGTGGRQPQQQFQSSGPGRNHMKFRPRLVRGNASRG